MSLIYHYQMASDGQVTDKTIEINKRILDNYATILDLLENEKFIEIATLINNYQPNHHFTLHKIYGPLSLYCIQNDDVALLTKLFGCKDFNLQWHVSINDIIKNNYLEKFLNVLDNVDEHCHTFNYFKSEIRNDVNILKLLLNHKYKIDDTYIYYIITNDYTNIITYLIENDYDMQNAIDTNPIYTLNLTTLKLLFQHNINFSKNLTLTYELFINHADIECVKFLMEVEPYDDINFLLSHCCYNCKLNLAKYFVGMGADIHSIARDIIIEASIYVVQYLFSCGYSFDEDLVNEILKIRFWNIPISQVKYLLGHGADMECVFDNEHFRNVISNDGLNHIKFLVENYYDLIEPKLNHMFIIACANGSYMIVEYFCKLGLKIDAKMMIVGCYYGNYQVVKTSFDCGFDYNDIDANLYQVICNGTRERIFPSYDLIKDNPYFIENDFHTGANYFGIFRLLIEYRAPVYDFEKIFIDLSYSFYKVDIIKFCIDNGMDINKHISLSACIWGKNIDLIKLLLENGIIVSLSNRECILVNNNEEMKKIFMDYGHVFDL
jgi:hypothetical protein